VLRGETNSVRALARWLGARLPARSGFGRATLDGKFGAAGGAAILSDATLTLDGATATGKVGVRLSGAKPLVTAALQLSTLDLNTYVGAPATAGEAQIAPLPPARGRAGAPPPKSIEDLLNAPAPGARVKGFAQRGGWSEEPFEAGDLGRIDLDARLAVGSIRFRKLGTGPGTVSIRHNDSILRASFEDLHVYDGRAGGIIEVDGAGEEPTVKIDVAVTNASVRPLLKDTAAIDWLAGTGNVKLAVSGKGRSERALVETLSGKANFSVANGSIGWSLAQAIGALGQGRIAAPDKAAQESEFSELAGSVTIETGVAHNQDLRMTTPLTRITGAGTVQLADRHIDYVLRPKLVTRAEGQAQQVAGLEVPVRIEGPWDDPHVTTDLSGVMQNPGQAWEAVKEIGKQFKGKKVDDVVKGLLGNEPGQSDRAKQLLNQFLKRQ
jgi:AsmA protein